MRVQARKTEVVLSVFASPWNPENPWWWKMVVTIALESVWISFLLLCNKSQEIEWLKTIPVYYLTVPVGQRSAWAPLGSLF